MPKLRSRRTQARMACGIEAELGDDVDADADRFRGRGLVGQRHVKVVLRDARMAVRIAGDADVANAVPLQDAAVDHLDGAAEITGRLIAVAGDHQQAVDVGLVAEPGEKRFEFLSIGEVAHREMRHRFKPGLPEPGCRVDDLGERPVRDRADVDMRAGSDDRRQRRDIVGRRPCRLDREAAREIGDRRDFIGAGGCRGSLGC